MSDFMRVCQSLRFLSVGSQWSHWFIELSIKHQMAQIASAKSESRSAAPRRVLERMRMLELSWRSTKNRAAASMRGAEARSLSRTSPATLDWNIFSCFGCFRIFLSWAAVLWSVSSRTVAASLCLFLKYVLWSFSIFRSSSSVLFKCYISKKHHKMMRI